MAAAPDTITAVQRQKAVTAYLKSKQLLPFDLEQQSMSTMANTTTSGQIVTHMYVNTLV